MKTFETKLDLLKVEASESISFLISYKGKESKFKHSQSLEIKDEEFMFNLDGGRYLVEVVYDGYRIEFVDNEGYCYDVFAIELEKFFQLADYLKKTYN